MKRIAGILAILVALLSWNVSFDVYDFYTSGYYASSTDAPLDASRYTVHPMPVPSTRTMNFPVRISTMTADADTLGGNNTANPTCFVSVWTQQEQTADFFSIGFVTVDGDTSGAKITISGGGYVTGDKVIAVIEADSATAAGGDPAGHFWSLDPTKAYQCSDTIRIYDQTTSGSTVLLVTRKR